MTEDDRTATALKAIRAALRCKGTKAMLTTRLGCFPTTKAAVRAVLPKLGEVRSTGESWWAFICPDTEKEAGVSAHDGGVFVRIET